MTEHVLQAAASKRLARLLSHDDPKELMFELVEIVEKRTYLQHGVEVREGDVVLDVGRTSVWPPLLRLRVPGRTRA